VKIRNALIACAAPILALGSALAADKAVPGTVPSAVANSRSVAMVPDIAALEAVDRAWMKYFNAGSANAMAVLYDENAVLLPPNAPAVAGRNAIRAFLAREMDQARKAGLTFSLDADPAGGVSGDVGWQSGTYAVKDKTGHVVETGKYLSVSRKQGRKWFYVRDTWNADAAPSTSASSPAPTAPATEPKK
jgi:ketosteroid isomerase-like protein